MSGAVGDERDLLAGEWVLGVLEGEERANAAQLLSTDSLFQAAVLAWDQRMIPIAASLPEAVPPADLWGRIEAAILGLSPTLLHPALAGTAAPRTPLSTRRTGQERGPADRARRWKLATAASLALAASLAGFIVWRGPPPAPPLPPAPPPALVAALAPTGGPAIFLAELRQDGLHVRPQGGITVPSGRDLQLWSLREGAAAPESMGVLPASGRTVPTQLPSGAQVLVSLEPAGGSPTGQPTGPVLYGGRLVRVE